MAQLISGRNLILFFREYDKRNEEDASRLKFQTEHTMSFGKDVEGVLTKDGIINTITDAESTADITSKAYIDDEEVITTWEILEEMYHRDAKVEVWEVDITRASPDNLEVNPTYYQGYFSNYEVSAPADGEVELSYTFNIDGKGVKGTDTLTAEQLSAIQSTLYVYESLKATGAGA